MRQYELVYIIRTDLEEEATEALIEKVKTIAENNGAEVAKIDKWGKRRLAYEINDITDGFYVIMNFKGDAAVAKELDRILKITEPVLRHIIVREDEK